MWTNKHKGTPPTATSPDNQQQARPLPIKAPPWEENDGELTTRPTAPSRLHPTKPRQRPATPWSTTDGEHDNQAPVPSRKRPSTGHDELQFERSTSPLAKRAVVRTTPKNLKQHVSDTAISWLIDGLENAGTTNGLSVRQRKYKQLFRGLMAPSGAALDHPAAPLLLELATLGCAADVGASWTMEMLEAAINKGAHPSAMTPEASAQLRAETLEKVAQGYARLVTWAELKHDPPKNLKISPIAAIPHKSRGYRMILDLSHGIRLHNLTYPSVNEATNPNVAPSDSMAELGNVLPRLIYAVATAPDAGGPILFSKLTSRMVIGEW